MYLFDTDVLSNLMSKRPSRKLLTRLPQISEEDQFTSAITVGELYYGAYRSPRADVYIEKLDRDVLPRLRIASFDRRAGEEYGRLRADLERHGEPLADVDLMIAAIALGRGFVLVTGNVRHFGRIQRLRVENWL